MRNLVQLNKLRELRDESVGLQEEVLTLFLVQPQYLDAYSEADVLVYRNGVYSDVQKLMGKVGKMQRGEVDHIYRQGLLVIEGKLEKISIYSPVYVSRF